VLLATDLAAAREFYHDRLGLEIIADLGFAWAAWVVDPGKNALGILRIKP
jgi:catechol 2,3-dioxygenase-like lactoylglutathione lyase family enzyme